MNSVLFDFQNENPYENSEQSNIVPWKILSVEDDMFYQEALEYSIQNLYVNDRPILLLKAASSSEASKILSENDDIALILLDVVMETDDAGLRLVETTRNMLDNQIVRIVILTGQPGMVPREEVVRQYDINEYWDKTELKDRLPSVITTNLKSWQAMKELEESRVGLQMVVDAVRSISGRHEVDDFAKAVLNEIAEILRVSQKHGGIICALSKDDETLKIITASGSFEEMKGRSIDAIEPEELREILYEIMRTKSYLFRDSWSGFYFPVSSQPEEPDMPNEAYLMVVYASGTLSRSHIRLLKVFAENVGSGFTKILLNNRLRELAFFNKESKLPNRNWLERELSLMKPDEWGNATLMLFRSKNHFTRLISFGNDFATEGIKKIIEKLISLFSSAITPIRFSQDVIGILCRTNLDFDIEKVRNILDMDLNINGIRTVTSLSMVYMHLKDFSGMQAGEIINTAKAAILELAYSIDPVLCYKPEQIMNTKKDFALVNKINPALEQGEMSLYLQPKINLQTEEPVGFEALIRWKQFDGNYISPGKFIPLAEKSGLIQKLDMFVLRETVRLQKILNSAGWMLPVSFNVSLTDLKERQFMGILDEILASNDLNLALFEMEITESTLMKEFQTFKDLFHKVRHAGMKIAIDDFGTGYSSLEYLARIPANTVKIDKFFIQAMSMNSPEMHVVDMVIRIADRVGFDVIAEGVETKEQAQTLCDHGCSFAQGFYFGKPMPIADTLNWLNGRTLN